MDSQWISVPKIISFVSLLPEILELELNCFIIPCLLIYKLWKLTFYWYLSCINLYEWSIMRIMFHEDVRAKQWRYWILEMKDRETALITDTGFSSPNFWHQDNTYTTPKRVIHIVICMRGTPGVVQCIVVYNMHMWPYLTL